MSRQQLLAGIGPLLFLAAAAAPGGSEAERVEVTNFPETQQVAGVVSIGAPAPTTRFAAVKALVAPGGPLDTEELTEGGAVDAAGFSHVTLSLAVTVRGALPTPGRVGALLIPEQPEVLTAMRDFGILQFPLAVEAPVAPSVAGLHQSSPTALRLAFPRYRVFFYNTTPKAADVTLYLYLGNS